MGPGGCRCIAGSLAGMATTRVMRSDFPDLADEVMFPRLSDAKMEWLAKQGERRRFSPARCSTSTPSATRRST